MLIGRDRVAGHSNSLRITRGKASLICSLSPCLKPPYRLEERRFFAKLLLGVRNIRAYAKTVLSAGVQGHLVRLGGVRQQRLDLRSSSRWHQRVGFWHEDLAQMFAQ